MHPASQGRVVDPHRPMDWSALAERTAPKRTWVIEGSVPCAAPGLMSGSGGVGKTLLVQQTAAAGAIGQPLIGPVSAPFRTLFWAGEDDHDELWRRQERFAAHYKVPLSRFANQLILYSFVDQDMTLATTSNYGEMMVTQLMEVLAQQINDYKPDLVVIDNIARVFGGNENARHEVTAFLARLRNAAAGTQAAVMLLGHPAKAEKSEFSGSSAWEAAVRFRLYLGDRPPDQKADDGPADEHVRYLARRKANYAGRDLITLDFNDGIFTRRPTQSAIEGQFGTAALQQLAEDCALRALRALRAMNHYPTASSNSPSYLPKLACAFEVNESFTRKDLERAMRALMREGRLIVGQVGHYPNRNPRDGLIEVKQ